MPPVQTSMLDKPPVAATHSAEDLIEIHRRRQTRRGLTEKEREVIRQKLCEEADAKEPMEPTVIGVRVLRRAPPIVI